MSYAALWAAADRRGIPASVNFLIEFVGFAAGIPFDPYSNRYAVAHHSASLCCAQTGRCRDRTYDLKLRRLALYPTELIALICCFE